MATASEIQPMEQEQDKGLKSGALGLVSSIVIGVASTAPAYSLAATLFFVVALVGFHAPAVAVLAFIPMLFCSIGYSELNKADPDCGTTFTWAGRAFGPKTGWAGGWGIVAADLLVMASLAQVAGQYVFLLVGADGIGTNPASGWVLLVGIVWIIVMTYICYRGIEVSANFQKALLSVEVVMLLVLSVTALVRVGTGHHPPQSVHPSISWLSPFHLGGFQAFVGALILMLFIYWGWDTAVSVNEETKDKNKTPGRAAIISTVLLLITYAIVIFSVLSFAGIGTSGIGLGNSSNSSDVLSVLGSAIFGSGGLGYLPEPAADPHGAQLCRRLHPDDDPAHRPHHPVDGRLQGAPQRVRQDSPALPHADRVHPRDGRDLHRPLHPHELHFRRPGHPRRGDRPRPVHRLLLRAHRLLLHLVLPQGADPERA